MANASTEARVFNACTGKPTTVLDLADTIAQLMQIKPDIRFDDPRVGDIRHSLGSPAEATAALGVQAETILEIGLSRLLDSLLSESVSEQPAPTPAEELQEGPALHPVVLPENEAAIEATATEATSEFVDLSRGRANGGNRHTHRRYSPDRSSRTGRFRSG